MLENWEVFSSYSKFLDEASKFVRVWRLNNTRGQNRDPIILREWARACLPLHVSPDQFNP